MNKPGLSYPIQFYLKLLFLHIKQNGWLWTFFFCLRHLLKNRLINAEKHMRLLEEKHKLPGTHSIEENALKWNHYAWERDKEPWTESNEWKAALVNDVLMTLVPEGTTVLEIGPGAGRWTEYLQKRALHLYVVDVSSKCIELTKNRFADAKNMEFYVNNGNDLDCINDNAIDIAWSFDVFVHIKIIDTKRYLKELHKKLKANSIAIIHHPTNGHSSTGWRSDMTLAIFKQLVQKTGFNYIKSISSWGPEQQYGLNQKIDIISVFQKPG